MMKNLYIGIDVAKDKLDICIYDNKSVDTLQIFNNETSILGLIDYLKSTYKKFTFSFGYEATSTYMNILKKVIHDCGYNQIMINPYQMSHYLKHLDSRNKTDIKDSIGIAKYIATLESDDFKTTYDSNYLLFQKHNTTIDLLSKISTQLKNLFKSQKNIQSVLLDESISALQKQIITLKKQIEKNATELMFDIFPQTRKIIEEISGVGSSLMLQLVPIFLSAKNYTIKQLQSYIGLSPRLFESGKSVKKLVVMSKRGCGLVRKKLYLSAMSAIRYNEIIKEKYQRLIENGKQKMVALVACMCHLFRAVFIKFNEYSLSSK